MTGRIRILQVSKSSGGVGQYLRMLVSSLDRDRFDVTAICLSEGGNELASDLSRIEGVKAQSLQMDRYKVNLISDLQVFFRLFRIIRQEKYDLIHAHTSKPGFLARLASIGTGIPTIYRPACFSFHDGVSKWKAITYAFIERIVALFFTDKIIAVCNDERELALRYHVGSQAQLTTIYTGIELNRFDQPVNRKEIRLSLEIPVEAFLIGCVGRLTEQKAPSDFVYAAHKVHQSYPDAYFVWVGDGELTKETKELVAALELDKVFRFARHSRSIPDILKSMDCFVLASHWEGFSISVLEAMAARLPVVVTRVSGASEAVVDGNTGCVIPIGDTDMLANAIGYMIANPEKAKMFGESGRRRMEQKFTLNRMVTEIEQVYEELVIANSGA
jgi:glycosyltransferase involved in cell wall biosynthesis